MSVEDSTWHRDRLRRRLLRRLRRLPPLRRPRPPRHLDDPTEESLDKESEMETDSLLLGNPPDGLLRKTIVLNDFWAEGVGS